MSIYANHVIAHTDEIIKSLARKSGDPLTQVVCIAYDVESRIVTGYGVNRVIKGLEKNHGVKETIATPQHDAKKFLMVHAEADFLKKSYNIVPWMRERTGIYMSLQPCMNCVNQLLDAGYNRVQWKTDNRHQEEQALMKPYLGGMLEYKQNSEGLHLQFPAWIENDS